MVKVGCSDMQKCWGLEYIELGDRHYRSKEKTEICLAFLNLTYRCSHDCVLLLSYSCFNQQIFLIKLMLTQDLAGWLICLKPVIYVHAYVLCVQTLNYFGRASS